MPRKLVIDGQIFQTPAWHRGMGKYSLELLGALSNSQQAKEWSSIDLLLSQHFAIDAAALSEIKNKAPEVTLVKLDLSPNDFRDQKLVERNRKIIDSYMAAIAVQPEQVDYLILSLMQGEIFPAFPTSNHVRKFLLFYDLVPLMLHETYLNSRVTKTEYLSKIAELLKADMYFTISKTIANDLSLYLGIDETRITNIDGGPIDHSDVLRPVTVPKPFMLMPTGNDPRKNNRRGILGFNEFNKLHDSQYTLVITSFFKASEREELGKLASKLHFTGNISGEELSYLYEQSSGLLFPSEYEGLGLPILEAVQKHKPVACSNISVFREISEEAFHYFEPKSVLGIERALNALVLNPQINKQAYARILGKYRWENTGAEIARAMLKFSRPLRRLLKPKLAVFGPNPASNDVCGKLMQDLHGELSRQFEADYYLATGQTGRRRVNYLPYAAKTAKIVEGFSAMSDDYQGALYHLANDQVCAEVLLNVLAAPGIVILYDMQLDRVWRGLVDKNLISPQRYQLEEQINTYYHIEGLAFLATLVKSQKGIIVFGKNQLQQLSKLLQLVNAGPHIYCVEIPTTSLPYPEATPNKTIDVGELYLSILSSNSRQIDTKTDFQYNEALSRMKTVIFDNKSSLYDIISAMQFSAIPFVSEELHVTGRPEKAIRKYKTVNQARTIAKELTADQQAYITTKDSVVKAITARSIRHFVQQLLEIIESSEP